MTGMLAAQSGIALSVRNLSTMGAIVFGTTVVSGMGTASLAAHEILRQAGSRATLQFQGLGLRVCLHASIVLACAACCRALRRVQPPAAGRVQVVQPCMRGACAGRQSSVLQKNNLRVCC